MGSNTAGNYIDESLPNITGSTLGDISQATMTGALKVDSSYSEGMWSGSTALNRMRNWSFDASRSSAVYQDDAKVRPDSLTCCYIIKY